jgi:cytochrome c peroxidase
MVATRVFRTSVLVFVAFASALWLNHSLAAANSHAPNLQPFENSTGVARSFSSQGSINMSSAFFQDLGTNGRTCATCHAPSDGWTVTPEHVRERFIASNGLDPIFRPVDGAVCPSADVSTVAAREAAYSMLLSKGLIRVSLAVPASAEFSVTEIEEPHLVGGVPCPQTNSSGLALFRRPLPATNLGFLSTVMWDGRESPSGRSLVDNLSSQAFDATLGHAQAAVAPTAGQVADIVAFEMSLSTAQSSDNVAGNLDAQGANGGPSRLSKIKFYLGINDVLGADPSGAAFNPEAMTLYGAWAHLSSSQNDPYTAGRAAVARGEELFNHFPITITGVRGLNDLPGLSTVNGTCTTCHDTPQAANHSLPLAINIGISDYPALSPLDTGGLPVYTLTCNTTGEVFHVTDPGRAMLTGKCADIGKYKGPILRGVASRPPYFHNGAAATLLDAVNFYNARFNMNLTEQQKQDLVAFLRTL